MNKKSLRFVICFVLIIGVILGGVLLYQKITDEQNLRGTYTFASARQEIKNIGKFVFNTPQFGNVTVYRQNNAWYFKEAGNYFANTDMITIVYAIISKSVIVSVMPATMEILKENNLLSEKESTDGVGVGTEITIYDSNENILDEVILSTVSGNSDYALARKNNSMYMYVVNSIGYFSGQPSAWIPYPLVSVQPKYLKSVVIDDKLYTVDQLRHFNNEAEETIKIVEMASFIDYQGIVKKRDFFASLPEIIKPREIRFNMIGGFIYVFRIYKVNDDYWLEIELANDAVSHVGVPPFVNEYQKYFSDWVFELFDENGTVFYEHGV